MFIKILVVAKMRILQTVQNLQFTEQFSKKISQVRKYFKVGTILLIFFTALVIFVVKNSKTNLLQSCPAAISLQEVDQNATTGALRGTPSVIVGLPSVIVGEQNDASKPANTSSNLAKHEQNLFAELASEFEKESCLSRYQSSSYRKNQPYKASPYLISKLRVYQDLHARCGPHTSSYKRVMRKLSSSPNNYKDTTPCKYLVWTPANGLGNRIVSITSAFLYALLESRVLLLDFGADMDNLFCEPFPKSTWLLPHNFPHKNHWAELPSFESMVHSGDASMSSPIVHLKLQHGNGDSLFQYFPCNDTQSLLESIPVIILLSDQYFVPSLFLIPSFKEELNRMFPEKGAVFNLLSQYLFNPSNEVWGLITRFYQAYLAKADEKIGLQIRAFTDKILPSENIMTQILTCTLNHHILPSLSTNISLSKNSTSNTKAILVSSLYPQFSEKLRSMFWTRPTLTRETVGIYQPSHEEYQKFGDNMHNMKAWAEIYLLSLSDVLVTSGQSTFGYVAQGLGGLKPWVLDKLGGRKTRNVHNPLCKRGISSEPCFHIGLKNDCSGKKISNVTAVYPYLRQCEDVWRGVKMVND